MIHLTLQFAAAVCLSCRPGPTTPPGLQAAFDLQTPQPTEGCARMSVHVDLNTSAVTVQDGITCGQLIPERDTQPVFDASRRVLRLPIVLRNATSGFVTAPVRVSFNADSIHRYRNGILVPGSGSTRTLNADSSNATGRVASWRYDTLLAPSGETQRLAPGERSRRLWLEFTGPELWLAPGGADADTTLSLRLDASGLFQIVTEVPALAPDTTPSWTSDDSSKVADARAPGLRFSRNLVVVSFKLGTTQQERAAAVGRVSGTVIGGKRLDGVDGLYLIQLPADPTNDRVFEALDVLKSDPAVSWAYLYWFMSGAATYLRPDDGSVGWTRSSWRVSRDSGYLGMLHPTWALEASNAARAWGCSVGDSLTSIAIVDQGVRAVGFADLVANVGTVNNGNQAGEQFLHGTHVAHVLAARGDNGGQMSGMMWRSRISLFDVSQRGANGLLHFPPNQITPEVHPFTFWSSLVEAARGARVISISLGFGDTTNLTLPAPPGLDSTIRQMISTVVANERAFAPGNEPLYVISTGNVAGRDAYYSRFPVLVDSLPDRVINVVGSDRARVLPWTPGTSSRIHVAAPGDSVGTWGAAGGLYQTGTSFATPLVAGVAGLLFSFDPTLTAAEVRTLIIQGAQAGGLTAGGVPLLDAYESLRLAAQRPGAPLCGNRLWGDSTAVMAERVLASGPVDETLTTVPTGTGLTYLTPMHGGKRLLNRGGGTTSWRELNWTPGSGWAIATPGAITDTAQGGTYWSSRALDHDLTRQLFASIVGPPAPGSPPTHRYTFTLSAGSPVLNIQSAPLRGGVDTSASADVCVKQLGSGSCGWILSPSYQSKVSIAMSPDGNRGFYAIAEIVIRPVASGPTNTCLNDTAATCTEFDLITEPTGPTQIFEIDFNANTAIQRWTVPGYVFRLGVSERDDEIVTTEGEQRFIQHHGWFVDQGGTGIDRPFVASSTFSPNTCQVVFRDVRTGTPTWGLVRKQVTVRPSTGCTLDASRDGLGGIAPRIRRTQ